MCSSRLLLVWTMQDDTLSLIGQPPLVLGDQGFRAEWVKYCERQGCFDNGFMKLVEVSAGNKLLHEMLALSIPKHPQKHKVLSETTLPGTNGTVMPSFKRVQRIAAGAAAHFYNPDMHGLQQDIEAYKNLVRNAQKHGDRDASSAGAPVVPPVRSRAVEAPSNSADHKHSGSVTGNSGARSAPAFVRKRGSVADDQHTRSTKQKTGPLTSDGTVLP